MRHLVQENQTEVSLASALLLRVKRPNRCQIKRDDRNGIVLTPQPEIARIMLLFPLESKVSEINPCKRCLSYVGLIPAPENKPRGNLETLAEIS